MDSDNTDSTCEADKVDSVQWLWSWVDALPFPPPDEEVRVTLESTCTGDLIVPDYSSNATTYCNTNILPKTVSNMDEDPEDVPSSADDDDDGEDVKETVAIVVSVSIAVMFLVVVGYCLYGRRAAAASSSGMGAGDMRTSLLTPSERKSAASGEEKRDRMLLRDDSGITAETAEL